MQSVWVTANLIPWARHNADLGHQGISGRPPLSPADQPRWFTVISRESLQDPAPLFNGYLAGRLLSKLHHANRQRCICPGDQLLASVGHDLIGSLASLQIGSLGSISLTHVDLHTCQSWFAY